MTLEINSQKVKVISAHVYLPTETVVGLIRDHKKICLRIRNVVYFPSNMGFKA